MAVSKGECHLKLVWLCKWLELDEPTFIARENSDRSVEVVVTVQYEVTTGTKESKEFVGKEENLFQSAKEDACSKATDFLRDFYWSNPTIPKFFMCNIFPDTDVAWRHAYEELEKCQKMYVEIYKKLKNELDYSSYYRSCLEEIYLRKGGNELLNIKQENCDLKWESRKLKLDNLALRKSVQESEGTLMDIGYKYICVKKSVKRLKSKLNDVQGSSAGKKSSRKRSSPNPICETTPSDISSGRNAGRKDKGKEKITEPVTPVSSVHTVSSSDDSGDSFATIRFKPPSSKGGCIGCGELWKH